jgi:DNA-binding transcriptional LysR family regulator
MPIESSISQHLTVAKEHLLEPSLQQLHQFYSLSQQQYGPIARQDRHQQEVLGQLEILLHCKLADQSHGPLKLTAAGKRLQQHCSNLLEQWINLQLTAQSMARPTQQIRIMIDEVVPSTPLIKHIPKMVSELPLHQISLSQQPKEQAFMALSECDADILIRCRSNQLPPRVASRHYSTIALTAVAAPNHDLCKGRQLTPEHLKLHRQLISPALPEPLIPKSVNYWEIDQSDVLIELAIGGVGWALVPHHWVNEALARGQLKELHMHDYSEHQGVELEILWLGQRREAGFTHCLNLLGALSHDPTQH